MSNVNAFAAFAVEDHERGAFLGGLLLGLIRAELRGIQDAVYREMGRYPTDEEEAKMREDMLRDAISRASTCFPEPIRSRVANLETEWIAAALDLN